MQTAKNTRNNDPVVQPALVHAKAIPPLTHRKAVSMAKLELERFLALVTSLSEDDWEKIVDLFEKIRPSMICRYLGKGEDVVFINFLPRKVDDGNMRVSLRYFKNPETLDFFKEGDVYDGKDLEHIDGNWYIIERLTDW